jgi:hypothetical protein
MEIEKIKRTSVLRYEWGPQEAVRVNVLAKSKCGELWNRWEAVDTERNPKRSTGCQLYWIDVEIEEDEA